MAARAEPLSAAAGEGEALAAVGLPLVGAVVGFLGLILFRVSSCRRTSFRRSVSRSICARIWLLSRRATISPALTVSKICTFLAGRLTSNPSILALTLI